MQDQGERLDGFATLEADGVHPKKRTLGASERELEFLRAAWRVLVAEALEAGRLVFVDEMGANTSLAPLHSWSRRGERARLWAARNRGKNTTLLASMSFEGMGPTLAVQGGTNKAVFEAYVEWVLAPSLRPGQVVVMDNTESGYTVAQRLRHTASASLMHFPLVFKTVSDQADSVLGRVPKQEEIEQITLLARVMYKAVLGLHFKRKEQKKTGQLPIF